MEATATVEGMHCAPFSERTLLEQTPVRSLCCASCAAGMEIFLTSQDGVEDASIDYDTASVHIEYTDEADLAELWEHIEEMGYEVDTDGD